MISADCFRKLFSCFRASACQPEESVSENDKSEGSASTLDSVLMTDDMALSKLSLSQVRLLDFADKSWDRLFKLFNDLEREFLGCPKFHEFAEVVHPLGSSRCRCLFDKPLDEKEIVQHRIQQAYFQCPPEAVIFMNLNEDYVDPSLENLTVLKCEVQNDTMVIVYSINSKKILTISPRFMMFVRVVKRFENGVYYDLAQSIDSTEFADSIEASEFIMRNPELFVQCPMLGLRYERTPTGTKRTTISETRPHFSIGFSIAKHFINNTEKRMLTDTIRNMKEYYSKRMWVGRQQINWFDDRIEEIKTDFDGSPMSTEN